MKRKVLISTICAAVLLGGSIAVVSAKDDGETSSEKGIVKATGELYSVGQDDRFNDDDYAGKTGSKPTEQAISESEAIGIAEKAVNGKMVEIELEHDDGVLKYELELRTDRGEAEVDINARTGEVIEIEYDDED